MTAPYFPTDPNEHIADPLQARAALAQAPGYDKLTPAAKQIIDTHLVAAYSNYNTGVNMAPVSFNALCNGILLARGATADAEIEAARKQERDKLGLTPLAERTDLPPGLKAQMDRHGVGVEQLNEFLDRTYAGLPRAEQMRRYAATFKGGDMYADGSERHWRTPADEQPEQSEWVTAGWQHLRNARPQTQDAAQSRDDLSRLAANTDKLLDLLTTKK